MLESSIIVSDVNDKTRKLLCDILENKLNYNSIEVASASEIMSSIYGQHNMLPEAVVMDVAKNTDESLAVLRQLHIRFPNLPVIVLIDYGNMKQVSLALEAGAQDFLARPVSLQRLKVSVDNAIRQHRLAVEVSRLRMEQAVCDDCNYIPTNNANIKKLLEQGAATDEPLLLCGENGTGKEAFAKAIHNKSQRANSAFVSINCNGFSEMQLFSVLFNSGNEDNPVHGKLSAADGGTLFLDNAEYMPHSLQYQLIDTLKNAKHDIRIMISTSLDVVNLRKSDKFTPEFLDMFTGDIMKLPNLRENAEEIDSLAHYFIQRFALRENPIVKDITPQAIELLKSYNWPGNLLEFERVVFRAVILSEDTNIDVEHLLPYMPLSFSPSDDVGRLRESINRSKRSPLTNSNGDVRRLRDLEEDMINFALNLYDGRISEVARKLGIGRSTLYRKLNDLDIDIKVA